MSFLWHVAPDRNDQEHAKRHKVIPKPQIHSTPPAGIYLLFQSGQSGQSGWGIPVATDIAFVAGLLALLGSRVPASLKVMLMSLAIADNIGAILPIAFFYSTDISFVALGFAAAGFGVTYIFNRIGVRQVSIYVVIGWVSGWPS